MRLTIVGHHLPGRSWWSDGDLLENVHVGVQVRSEPVGLVPGDASGGTWTVDVAVRSVPDDGVDFAGPAVHGRRRERFVYLTWGDVAADGDFRMFRRAKLMLDRIEPAVLRAAVSSGELVATIDLTDDRGCPRCARVDPPALRWSAR
jgi:Family of unknown function (DUF5990)